MTKPHLLQFTSEIKKTAMSFRELHAAPSAEALNQEWLLLENTGANTIVVRGCQLTVAENVNRRSHILGTLDPGFVLPPGGKVRIVTGTPARRAEGAPPVETDDVKNYHLFLKEPVLSQEGIVLRITLRQGVDLARACYQPDQPGGVGAV